MPKAKTHFDAALSFSRETQIINGGSVTEIERESRNAVKKDGKDEGIVCSELAAIKEKEVNKRKATSFHSFQKII